MQLSMFSLEGHRAKAFRSLDCVKAWLTLAETSLSLFLESLIATAPNGSFGKTSLPTGAKHPTERRKVRPSEGVLDVSKPYPHWRGDVAHCACAAAADRVVRAWRTKLEGTEHAKN